MRYTYPVTPEQLTPEWLTARLRAAGLIKEATVTDVTTSTMGEGVGLVAMIVRLHLCYDRHENEAPSTVVAKFPSDNPASIALASHFKVYERETKFLRDIAPTIDMPVPRVFAAEVDDETGAFVLVMEDLDGYDVGDQVAGCTADQAHAILAAVAPLHARFWNDTDRPELGFVPHVDAERQSTGISGGCQVGWDPCVARFGHVMDDAIKAAKDRFVASMPELHRIMGAGAQTAIHGDLRLDNILFGTTPQQQPIVLLDWQGFIISSTSQDLAYLLSQNVTIKERRAHEGELLERFHGELVRHGVTGYSLDDLWADYQVGVLYVFGYAVVIGGTLDAGNERGFKFIEQLIHRASETIMDHGLLAHLPV